MIYEKDLVEALHLSIVLPSPTGELPIEDADTCRPGLQLTGYWDFFAYERPQLFGKVEMAYLNTLDEETLNARLNTFFSFRLPCVIVCRDLPIPEPMLRCARQRKVPIYRTQANTVKLEMDIINYLNTALAPIRTMHGVLVDVYGVGLMITGNSGVGKSESALELVKRGHRLVADDVVEVRRVSDSRLTGTAPENIRHLMEIRGIGIIDVYTMYGVASVIKSTWWCTWSFGRRAIPTTGWGSAARRRRFWAYRCLTCFCPSIPGATSRSCWKSPQEICASSKWASARPKSF